jgi:hypothetical protein
VNYLKSLLLYQDEPVYGLPLKMIMLIVPAGLLVLSVYLWSSGENSGSIALLSEAFIFAIIFWAVFPRRYQVYEDHLRIVLGKPFSIKVGFESIKAVELTSRTSLTVNFVTNLAKTYVLINKKTGLSIAITPRNNALFVENANQALKQWERRAK